ncbi:hypothetical protein AAY473_040037 [Plecturocebus cupreus]
MGGAPKAESEQLAFWTSYPPLYYMGMAGPPLWADNLLTSCLFYHSPAEGSEKMQDSSSAELLPFSPQAHSYLGPPLAVPKLVYCNPLCYGLSTCLGEGAVKRPLDVDWTLVTGPLLPLADPPCSLTPAPSKRDTLDGTFLKGAPAGGSSTDSLGSFSPCQPFLESTRPSTALASWPPGPALPSSLLPPREAGQLQPSTFTEASGRPQVDRDAEEKTCLPSCRKEELQPSLSEHSGLPIPEAVQFPVPPPALSSCAQECQSLPQKEGARLPSFPPMPVIDNVFSLAPYHDYLDVPVPEATVEPDSAPDTNESQDKSCRGILSAHEGLSGSKPLRGSPKEEVALDLSVRKPTAKASPIKAPSPVEHAKLTAAMGMPYVGNMASDLPVLKKIDMEAPEVQEPSSGTFACSRGPIHAHLSSCSCTACAHPYIWAHWILAQQPLSLTHFSLALPSLPVIAVASPGPAPAPSPALALALAQAWAPASAPAPSPAPDPALASTSTSEDSLEQHFTGLDTSLCDAMSGSVAHSPPEKLHQKWLEMAGSWGRTAWQDCQGVQGLLAKLLFQLQRFYHTHHCPFPNVVGAGDIFVPIPLVKEWLFPWLPPAFVDHVLQEHHVELWPTTLSEEWVLWELFLPGCTSCMLKLLELCQLPDIYPDLLGLQWRDCVCHQLGDFDTEAGAVSPSEPSVARDEPESLALTQKSPAPKVRKPGGSCQALARRKQR